MANLFKHILVPFNGTTQSKNTFKKAVSLATTTQAKITILTCLEECLFFGFFKTKTSKKEYEREQKIIQKEHKELEDFAVQHNIDCKSKIVKSSLASTGILNFAKSHDVDLIIMSRTKLHTVGEKQSYWSTLENVFRNASCPLLILQ